MNTRSPISINAQKVLDDRYLLRDKKGVIAESAEQLFKRVACAVAGAELKWGSTAKVAEWEGIFYDAMSRLAFLPNSPTLMNAGTPQGQLSACFVLPVEDSLDSIFTTLKQAALIQKSGGGTGFNFSHLRPKNDLVATTGGVATGPVSFMKVFNAATEQVKQGGKRRGANMGILNMDHPDIEEFISCKQEEGVLTSFNISVGVPDTFLLALEQDGEWPLRHPSTKEVVGLVKAKQLWDDIVSSAWQTGDPGLIFLDTINTANPTPPLGLIEATNPCGEVPLLPYEACNLGSINLGVFVRRENAIGSIDWPGLAATVQMAVRFLDNVIDINHYPMEAIRSIVDGNRKIGLGIMGWADLLSLLEIPYDTEEALRLADRLMHFVQQESLGASGRLAEERGVFPNWPKSIFYPGQPMRNATRLSIAPTGTISIIAGASSSIEPLFALAYHRQGPVGEELEFFHQPFKEYLRTHQLMTDDILREVAVQGHAGQLSGLPARVKQMFKTALEIAPEWHLRHQAVFQQYTDNAVSKTINLPETATTDDISRIYKMAWQQKLKGVTVFRNNCRRQVLHRGIPRASQGCKVCTEFPE